MRTESAEALVQIGPQRWIALDTPEAIFTTDEPALVTETIAAMEAAVRANGWHAVGFLSYEAGAGFGLPVCEGGAWPAAWFAAFSPAHVREVGRPRRTGPYTVGPISPVVDRASFGRAFARIKQQIADGNTYQVNYTFPLRATFHGEPLSLFADLVRAQQGAYGAFIRIGDRVICSASPELFFSRDGSTVTVRPMKGTAGRGRTTAEDDQQRDNLVRSSKQRAENVMIVDMMRNDLGRIAVTGSVAVPRLFDVERYPTLWQMTSSVTAETEAPLHEIVAALHPSASVTGAPKVSTMGIIRALEDRPRGVYTGAIGHVAPEGSARFSVAIRTAVVDADAGTLEFGVGSGIVWDSEEASEYDECLLKGAILTARHEAFDLLETLRWAPGEGYFLLDRHLRRLVDSSRYFGVACDSDAVRVALEEAVAGERGARRVRLLLGEDGEFRVEKHALVPSNTPLRVAIARQPVNSADVFLFHKTTNRGVFERARVGVGGLDDVILWNEAGEITEATTANVVVEREGVKTTPPVRCGLLGGTFRAELLARGDIVEGVLTKDDLHFAPRLWLVNSVHKWRAAVLEPLREG